MTTTIIHVGDIGTIFELTITEQNGTVIDVSTVTTKAIYFRKPTGTSVTKTASFTTDGSDGKIQYTSVSGDIDTIGLWKMQGFVVFATGEEFYSETVTFTVRPNISS